MDGWFITALIVCLLSTGACVVAAVLKKKPNDITLLSMAAIELFLLVFLVASIVRSAGGEPIAGEPWEFWGYLATAMAIPIAGFYWAILERTFWSNYVLAAVGATVLVMMARMAQIWYGTATLHGTASAALGAS
ncbi:hypothetical protein [Arthrobacter sp. 35W]|uniref:hypothetical protein n=1 Tax=Arthrobacter sp. 35W TaxID=1132441 RepID=UPI0005524561|nr:hypothetical protein [Arthrobacter sp. 35W]